VVTPAEPPAHALRARGICVVVEGDRSGALRRRQALRGLEGFSIDVAPGEVVHLVGAPDSGVVEAIEVLGGARVPDAGRLVIEGREVPEAGRRAREAWSRVALLGGPSGTVPSRRTVLEVVAEDVRRAEQQPVKSVQPGHRERAEEILDIVGLPSDTRAQRERDLTGEALGRVRLARLLAKRPAVVAVPPPGSPAGVDAGDEAVGAELVDSILARLRTESGTAVLRAADTMPSALSARERVVVLCGGRVVEILDRDGLGHPLHPWTRAHRAGRPADVPRPDAADPGCPFRQGCDRAQARCAERMPELTRPLGATHPVACWFPEDPRQGRRTVPGGAGVLESASSGSAHVGAHGDEPTAHEFVEG
jgi:ABC-type glutathione transport system ATPase component